MPMKKHAAGTILLMLAVGLTLDPALLEAAERSTLLNDSLRMTWGLLVVLAVIFIVYLLVKKRMMLLQGSGKGIIKVVETRHLMPKKSLFLVQVRGQEFLIGCGGETIELIARIDQDTNRQDFKEHLHTARSGQAS